MEMVPESVGRAARRWDEQHLDLHAAARQLGAALDGAVDGGLTPSVARVARRFVRAWEGHVEQVAQQCETHADGLRLVLADWLETDAAATLPTMLLRQYLTEQR